MRELRRDSPGAPDIRRQARSFGFLLAAMAAATGLWRFVHGHGYVAAWLASAGVFAALSLWWIGGLVPLTRAWLKFGELLHAIVNPVVMALLYVLAIVPTGLVMRLAGKDPLRLKKDPGAASYWVPRGGADAPVSSMEDQF
jgi:hypothetical protein